MYWLYLHPYVHLSIRKSGAILFNTLSGKLLEYKSQCKEYELIKRLNQKKILYVVMLTPKEIEGELGGFIEEIRNYFFGDIIECNYSSGKPIQMRPALWLDKKSEGVGHEGVNSKLLKEDELSEYLESICLYINNQCDRNCKICSDALKQFPFCHKNEFHKSEIGMEYIRLLLTEIKRTRLFKLKILGGDITRYSSFSALIALLNRTQILKEYVLHYLNYENVEPYLKQMCSKYSIINILVNFSIERDILKRVSAISNTGDIKMKFSFVLQNEDDFKIAQRLISENRLNRVTFLPFFNGYNLDFFETEVFINKTSIQRNRPNMKEILARGTLNTYSFKKLSILSNRKIYANLNNPSIGVLGKNRILDVIDRELETGKSWRKIRKNVDPCKGCAFNLICPPISNYEYVIGRNNLCHVLI